MEFGPKNRKSPVVVSHLGSNAIPITRRWFKAIAYVQLRPFRSVIFPEHLGDIPLADSVSSQMGICYQTRDSSAVNTPLQGPFWSL